MQRLCRLLSWHRGGRKLVTRHRDSQIKQRVTEAARAAAHANMTDLLAHLSRDLSAFTHAALDEQAQLAPVRNLHGSDKHTNFMILMKGNLPQPANKQEQRACCTTLKSSKVRQSEPGTSAAIMASRLWEDMARPLSPKAVLISSAVMRPSPFLSMYAAQPGSPMSAAIAQHDALC